MLPLSEEVRHMWWQYVLIGLFLVGGIFAFGWLIRYGTRVITRRTDQRAEDLYDSYANDRRPRSRRQHGGAA